MRLLFSAMKSFPEEDRLFLCLGEVLDYWGAMAVYTVNAFAITKLDFGISAFNDLKLE